MEGVMMRNGDAFALAVRRPDGEIVVELRPWFCLTRCGLLKKPFLRGFPLMLETLINGIRALHASARESGNSPESDVKGRHLLLALSAALIMAVGLFVVVPHFLSLMMTQLGLGADVEGITFHIWDGIFKFVIFISYILAVSLLPEIRRVFRYHGAEHKTIRAYEAGDEITARNALRYSRLHPRCGTTFVLFVLALAIVLHTVSVPPLLRLWPLENPFARHAAAIGFKLLLMIPISAIAYELIRWTAQLGDGLWGKLLRGPGMLLQLLTTWEPDEAQLEVAAAALRGALRRDAPAVDVPLLLDRLQGCPGVRPPFAAVPGDSAAIPCTGYGVGTGKQSRRSRNV